MLNNDIIFESHNFKVIEADIFNIEGDVLVLSANPACDPGNGLDALVYEKAGKDRLTEARFKEQVGDTANVGVLIKTDAFDLKNYSDIYHIVTPSKNVFQEAALNKLIECYKTCVEEADNNRIGTIVFPLLGTAHLGYDICDAYNCAKEGIIQALYYCDQANGKNGTDLQVTLAVYGKTAKIVREIESSNDPDFMTEYDAVSGRERALRLQKNSLCSDENSIREITISKTIQEINDYISSGKDRTAEGFMYREYSRILNEWILSRPQGMTKEKHYEAFLPYGINPKTVANLIKYCNGNMTDDVLVSKKHYPQRMTKIGMALAMRLPLEERVRFIILGKDNYTYPANEVEKLIEKCLSENPEATADDINKMAEKLHKNSIFKHSDKEDRPAKKHYER